MPAAAWQVPPALQARRSVTCVFAVSISPPAASQLQQPVTAAGCPWPPHSSMARCFPSSAAGELPVPCCRAPGSVFVVAAAPLPHLQCQRAWVLQQSGWWCASMAVQSAVWVTAAISAWMVSPDHLPRAVAAAQQCSAAPHLRQHSCGLLPQAAAFAGAPVSVAGSSQPPSKHLGAGAAVWPSFAAESAERWW